MDHQINLVEHLPRTPVQLIRKVYGLRGAEQKCAHLTLIGDDSSLMDMDAPVCIPAGSFRREEPLRHYRGQEHYFIPRETVLLRGLDIK